MKRLTLIMLIAALLNAAAFAGTDRRNQTPKVRYIKPANDSVVDLTGRESLVFTWKPTPKPGGGRTAYRFELFKDFGYEVVEDVTLEHDIYAAEVDADKLINGAAYSWQVKQRDRKTHVWSMDNRWGFKVKK
ncbi:MAG: hypothetical protein JW994_02850 [Candidatus Omnitrophica bacterium]|nr:hypothetical protein [Candidatus Omnitrophota bacterium]